MADVRASTLASLQAKKDFYTERLNIPQADITALSGFQNGGSLTLGAFSLNKLKQVGQNLSASKAEAPAKIAEIDAIVADLND